VTPVIGVVGERLVREEGTWREGWVLLPSEAPAR
jgi:hypothetical protein